MYVALLEPPIDRQYLAVDPSRQQQIHHMPSMLIKQPRRRALSPTRSLPPLLRMPPEVLDLISDFLMDLDTTCLRPSDPILDAKAQSLQNLRYTCRQMVFPILFIQLIVVSPLLPQSTFSILPPCRMSSLPQHRAPNSNSSRLTIPRFPPASQPSIPNSSCSTITSIY